MWRVSTVVRTAQRYWNDGRGKIFVAVSAGWFLSIGIRMTYPVLLPFLRVDYDLSLTMAGFLLTVLWLAYAIGQIPGGVFGDRFGEGLTMAASMALAAGVVALIVVSDSVVVLFGGSVLLGGAIALFGVVRLTSLADVYPEQVGTVHGFLGAVGDIGSSVLPPLVGVVAAATIWQFGLGLLIPVFIVAAMTLWVFVPTRTSPSATTSGQFTVANVRHVLSEVREPTLMLTAVIFVSHVVIGQAFTGFYPTYLIEEKGVPVALASGLFASYFALGIIIRPLAGNLYDQIGIRKSLLFIVAISAVGFALLPMVEGFVPLLVLTILIAFVTGRGTITLAYLTISLSADVQNTGLGIVRTVSFTIGAMSPLIFGAIADRGYFDEGFLLLAGVSGVTLLVILRLPSIEN